MPKTNDHARAARAVADYQRLGSPKREVLQALQARLARYDDAYYARKAAEASAKASKSLAVSYAAYLTATDDQDVIVWGQLLRADQRATGAFLFSDESLARHVRLAQSRSALKVAA